MTTQQERPDWGTAGLPCVGTVASEPSAAGAADPDVPTCSLADDLRLVRERVRASGWDQCIVVNDERIVLGRLGRKALVADDERTVEEAMSAGPSTVRPSVRLAELQQRLVRQGLGSAFVTTNEGRLIGVIRRDSTSR